MSSSDAELACEATRIAARNRTRSPLLGLPGELRNKILAFAIGGHTVVVEIKGYESASPFEPSPDIQLIFRLTISSQAKPSMGVDGDSDGGRDDVDDLQHKVDRQITDTERVSQIFTVTRVCRQLYTETALIQYKNNYFHFSSPRGLEAFTKQLTFGQRRAITAISIDEQYVLQKFPTLGGFFSSLGLLIPVLPVPDLRQMLPGLRKIFMKPEGVRLFAGATAEDKLIRVVKMLEIGGERDKGLWIGCFDVLDETAVLHAAWGFLVKSAENGESDTSVPSSC